MVGMNEMDGMDGMDRQVCVCDSCTILSDHTFVTPIKDTGSPLASRYLVMCSQKSIVNSKRIFFHNSSIFSFPTFAKHIIQRQIYIV